MGLPQEGTYAAYNMFDGTGPLTYTLTQSVNILDNITSAGLSWMEAASWGFSGADRTFSIDLFDATGTILLANLFTETFSVAGTIPWSNMPVDITSDLLAYQGNMGMLGFSAIIPATWTRPAGLGLDAISFDIQTTSILEPARLALLGLGLVGIGFSRKIKQLNLHYFKLLKGLGRYLGILFLTKTHTRTNLILALSNMVMVGNVLLG